MQLVWFRSVSYFRDMFEKGQLLIASGKLDYFNTLQISHPDFELFDPDDRQSLIHVGRIVPLYPSTETLKKKGLDSRGFRRLILAAFENADLDIPETGQGSGTPESLLRKRTLMDRREALRNLHFPDSPTDMNRARRRIKYEELYLLSLLLYHKRQRLRELPRELHPAKFGEAKLYEELLEG